MHEISEPYIENTSYMPLILQNEYQEILNSKQENKKVQKWNKIKPKLSSNGRRRKSKAGTP